MKIIERRLSRHSFSGGGRIYKFHIKFVTMFYVYILNSLTHTERMYVGRTQNLEHRLAEHNAGECVHTNKYKPWKLCTYIVFDTQEKAIAFEYYLKSGSGRAFAKKRL